MACYLLALCFFIFKNDLNASRLGHSTFVILRSLEMILLNLSSLINPCLVSWKSWEICHRCAKILLAAEHKMQLAYYLRNIQIGFKGTRNLVSLTSQL